MDLDQRMLNDYKRYKTLFPQCLRHLCALPWGVQVLTSEDHVEKHQDKKAL